jgi:glucuronate isomerase
MPSAGSEPPFFDRLLGTDEPGRSLARRLYDSVSSLPIVSPHGHVPVELLADPDARLGPPGHLFVTGDHYLLRMLYSQGIPLEALGLRPLDGSPAETDDRKIWQRLCDNLPLFAGTPSGLWLAGTLSGVFGVEERLSSANAQAVYDLVAERLASPDFAPRALLDRFSIEALATTDAAESRLDAHRRLRDDGLGERVRPTFRPESVTALASAEWRPSLTALEAACDREIGSYRAFVEALEERRAFFKEVGATAADHAIETVHSTRLSETEAATIFRRALGGEVTAEQTDRFSAHMLWEMARMSREDGLVMQIRAGSLRDHNPALAERFGHDIGADIPVALDWTRGLRPILAAHGNDSGLRLVLSTLDESSYSRELAPLAGHYPAVFLGPPWWFHDSPNGVERYLDSVSETAGFHNLSGFADDAHNLVAIPARHDLWRRTTCAWLARRVLGGVLGEEEAAGIAAELACGLARKVFRLPEPQQGKPE